MVNSRPTHKPDHRLASERNGGKTCSSRPIKLVFILGGPNTGRHFDDVISDKPLKLGVSAVFKSENDTESVPQNLKNMPELKNSLVFWRQPTALQSFASSRINLLIQQVQVASPPILLFSNSLDYTMRFFKKKKSGKYCTSFRNTSNVI
ncbi:hypothetical protein AVEN_18449-1 [Araneus ventricosus]|uniref:Uncharacterized protein n=1 Tax=Araneus ventricosus TaxID=182803 RepID=A0A4Y2MGR6_ARAVE|nr:hypothetical protein AVEN_18449-1 [Araneus ventricosus]